MKFSEESVRSMVMKYKPVFLPLANYDIIRIDDALSDYPDKARRLFMEMDKKVRYTEKQQNKVFILSL